MATQAQSGTRDTIQESVTVRNHPSVKLYLCLLFQRLPLVHGGMNVIAVRIAQSENCLSVPSRNTVRATLLSHSPDQIFDAVTMISSFHNSIYVYNLPGPHRLKLIITRHQIGTIAPRFQLEL